MFFIKLAGFSGADPGFFLGGGALVSCSTLTPINHIVFFCRIPVVLENRRSSRGGGVRTPCTLPLDPPLFFIDFVRCVIKFASVLLIQHASYLFCMVIIKHPSNYFKVCMILINLVRVLYQITFDIFIVLPFVCNYIYIFCNYLWKALMNVCIIEFCKHFIKFESVLLLSLHVLY